MYATITQVQHLVNRVCTDAERQKVEEALVETDLTISQALDKLGLLTPVPPTSPISTRVLRHLHAMGGAIALDEEWRERFGTGLLMLLAGELPLVDAPKAEKAEEIEEELPPDEEFDGDLEYPVQVEEQE